MIQKSNQLDNFTKKPLNIKFFFISSYILFGILITLITFYINYNHQLNELEKDILNNAKIELTHKTDEFKDSLSVYKQQLLTLKNSSIDLTKEDMKKLFSYIINSDSNIMQIRFLDNLGIEKIREERLTKNSKVVKIGEDKLQDKSDRYYFKEIINTKNDEIWISNIDLNIENKKVQKPLTYTIRLATKLYENNNFKGIIIFNLFMEDFLNRFEKSEFFKVSLINEKGEYIFGNEEPNSKKIYSKNIADELSINQNLNLIFHTKQIKLNELKESIINTILNTLSLVFVISIIIGLVLSVFPLRLARELFKAKDKMDDTQFLLDTYIEAMNVNNIISKSDLKGNITYVNDNFCKVSGYSQEEVLGKPHSLLRAKDTPKDVFKEMWSKIKSKKIWTGTIKNRKKDGGFYYINSAIVPILNKDNEIIEYLGISHNITELVEHQQYLEEMATRDSLTNFYNRAKLLEDIDENKINNLAVLDIDNFSAINDFYGHIIGDIVIKKFALLIKEFINNKFILYRLHGDKFAVLDNYLEKDDFKNEMIKLNNKLIDSIIDLEVKTFDIITTIGISFEHKFELLLTAENANKYAKKTNTRVMVYSKKLQIEKEFEDNLIWVTKIKSALTENRVMVQYQPIFNNKTKRVEKYEVLVRLKDESGNLVSPYYFLDISKKSKQYIYITKKIIDLSFNKFKDIEDVEFSINLTIEDILDDELINYLITKIEEYNIGEKLVLELVESENIENFENIGEFVKRIKQYGCKIAIDDFGTGYSNFEYLIKIDADYVKLDGSLIKNINDDVNSKEIVKTIVEFAKKMNFKTIAEFVADKNTFEIVQSLDIDYSQGFYIGKPENELLN